MEDSKRDLIQRNIDNLIRTTEYATLKAECMLSGLLFQEMIDKIENHITQQKKHRALLEKITHRGPTAFKVLLNICEANFIDAYDILTGFHRNEKYIKAPPVGSEDGIDTCGKGNERNRTLTLAEFNENIEPSAFEVVRSDRCYSTDTAACYSMSSNYRGVAFIINIVNFDLKKKERREGALVDKRDLINLFRGLGFIVFYYEDITKVEMDKLIDQLVESPQLRRTDCLFFAILSHGSVDDNVDHVEFRDSSYVRTDMICNRFNNTNCISLVGKPKIFLFPFCRGPAPDSGVEANRPPKSMETIVSRVQKDTFNLPKLPTINDVMICYATVPGFETMRDPAYGSWYIESMCKIWAQSAHNLELKELLDNVGKDVQRKQSSEGHIQTGSYANIGFFKKLFFNPGFYSNI